MLSRFRHETGQGLIAGMEFGDPVRQLNALFLHATGFNAMTYQSILAPLGLRARVASMDLRGHGRTTLATKGGMASWTRYRNDVIDWLDRYAPDGLVLGGHSMGACVSLMVAGKRPDLVKALVLADPVILPPSFYRQMHLIPFLRLPLARKGLAAQARKRRSTFASVQEARDRYQGRGAFTTWREPFLDDFLLDGVDRTDTNPHYSDDQTWELLCDPKWEAATFAAQRNRPWSALGKVRKHKIPLVILKADKGSVLSEKVTAKILRKVPFAQIKTLRGTTHFLPMEAPYAVRDEFSRFLSRMIEGFSAGDEGPVRRTLGVVQGRRSA